MADNNFEKELKIKPYLTKARKVGGRVVYEELIPPTFDEDEALDTLLDGVDDSDVSDGRDRLMRENPQLARDNIHAMLDLDFSAAETQGFTDPVREAGVKRAGKLAFKDTGDTVNFRRMTGGRQVELSGDDGAVLETLSNLEFDGLLGTGDYIVL